MGEFVICRAEDPKNRWKIPSGDFSALRRHRILGQVGPNATLDVAMHPPRLVLSKFLSPVSILLEIAIVLQLGLGEYVEASIIGLSRL
jgi:H+-transporting ATPase